MAARGRLLAAVAIGLIAGITGFAVYRALNPPSPAPATSAARDQRPAAAPVVGQRRPDFRLPDVEGEVHDVSAWDGKVLLINFWATWCPPCRREIPALIAAQERLGPRGLQVVGIAIDQPDLVEEYADTMGVNYPVLVGELEAIRLTEAFGNRYGQLPYTVVVDREGIVRYVHRGEITGPRIEEVVEPLL